MLFRADEVDKSMSRSGSVNDTTTLPEHVMYLVLLKDIESMGVQGHDSEGVEDPSDPSHGVEGASCLNTSTIQLHDPNSPEP
jgi:hypothetical protein